MRSSGNVVYAKVLLGEVLGLKCFLGCALGWPECSLAPFACPCPWQDGRSKGCAIVEFETAEEAGDAILNLQNSSLDGREIWVREDREDRGPRQ